MSVDTLKRSLILAAGALLAVAQAARADFPSGRTLARMVFDPSIGSTVLFGGQTAEDLGTSRTYDLSETWIWNGARCLQRYPAHVPPGRSAHVMVYDSARERVVIFGGKSGTKTEIADTWAFKNGDWSDLAPASGPSRRAYSGGAYDPTRDRIVIFGGYQTTDDGKALNTLTDTWEFDGTTWTQVAQNGPAAAKPLLVWDEANSELLMLALDSVNATQMYAYDAANHSWTARTPAALPPCVNEAAVTFDKKRNRVLLVGGICPSSSVAEEAYEWDGSTWTKIERGDAALSFAAKSSVSGLRPKTTGTAPSAARPSVTAPPIPAPPPVTMTTLSFRPRSIVVSLSRGTGSLRASPASSRSRSRARSAADRRRCAPRRAP